VDEGAVICKKGREDRSRFALPATVSIMAVIDMRQPFHSIVLFLSGGVIFYVALFPHSTAGLGPAFLNRYAVFLLIGGLRPSKSTSNVSSARSFSIEVLHQGRIE